MSNNDLFISYSRRDKPFVQQLFQAIEASGRDAWVDWENIPLTAEWFEEIKRGIEGSDAFMFVISPDSVASEICQAEVEYSIANHKRMVPILRRDVTPEERVKLHAAVSSHNWIFFREEDDFNTSFEALIRALDTDLGYVRAHTRLQTRALEWDNKGRDLSFVLRGRDLAEAETWRWNALAEATKQPQVTDLQTDYIRASRVAERVRRRERIFTFAITAALALAIAALGIAVYQSNRARDEADHARRLSLSANSRIALDNSNRDLAIALALAANQGVRASSEAERALSDAAYSPGTRLVYRGHTAQVNAVTFSPDGQYALSGSTDTTLRLWEALTGEDQFVLEGHTAAVQDLTFNDDGTRIASVDSAGELWLWDAQNGEALLHVQAHEGTARTVRFSPDDTLMATGGDDRALRWWDAETGERIGEFPDFAGPVDRVLFDPSTGYVLVIAINANPSLISLDSGRVLRQFPRQVTTYDNLASAAAVFLPDGNSILYAAGISPRLWDIYGDGNTIREFVGHGSNVNALAVTQDGRFLLSGASRENSMRKWDVNTGVELARFDGHDNIINSVAVSPSGRYALSASDDTTVRVWDLENGALINTFTTEGMTDIYGVDFSPDASAIVSGEVSGAVRLWDASTGENVNTFEGHTGRVWAVSFSPDGKTVLSGGDDKTMRLWDVQTGDELHTFDGHDELVTSLTFNADGTRALSGSNDRKIRLWDLTDLSRTEPLMVYDEADTQLDGQLRALAFSPDGVHFAAGANTGRLIHLETGEIVQRFPYVGNRLNTLAFRMDGAQLVTGHGNGAILLWDVETGEVLRQFDGHTSQVRSVVLDANEAHILSSSADTTIRLWNIDTGLEERQYKGHAEWINQAVFSPDFETVVSGSWDDTLKVWHMHDRRELMAWVSGNRYERVLSCNDRRIYLLEPPQSGECNLED